MSDPSPFKTPDFWIAVAVALIIKIKTTATLGPWQVMTTVLAAVGAAWVLSLQTVTVGAADSGGEGFQVLRIPNP